MEKPVGKLTYPLSFYLAEHRNIQSKIPKRLSKTTSKEKIQFEGVEINERIRQDETVQKRYEVSQSTSSLQ